MLNESGSAARVLIVEDNPGDARLTREMLLEAGWPEEAITHAGSLAEACDSLQHQPADVVLLDLSLPDANDLTSLAKLQQVQPTLPIVVLSGYDDEERAFAAVQEGAQDYLVKGDISVDAVRRAARYAIERKRLTQSFLEAKLKAEHASQAKTQFLANMSHELRTPLNAIIGFAEVLEQESKGPLGHPSYSDYVRDIRDSGRHLLTMINTILDISKIEAGQMELTEEPVELRAVVSSVTRLLRNEAAKAEVELTEELPDDLPSIYADSRLLRQIYFNLVNNAIKFSNAGGRVLVKVDLASCGSMLGQVEDDGIGIEADQLELITQPFIQAQSTLTRCYQGTGLGLSIVKSFVELHGGRLSIESEPGQGTLVSFKLPADRVMREDEDPGERQGAEQVSA